MNARKLTLVIFVTLLLLMGSACKHLVPDHFEIETTSELGPNTLDRIDDLNDTIATGVEIGPETRAIIEQLNETINEGLEFGFKPDILDRHPHAGGCGQEKWSIGLMCADKNNSKFFSDIYLKPKVNNTVALNPSYYEIPGDYTCTIAGYDVKNVNIEDDSAGDIIQVFTRKDYDGEWHVTEDFLDEGGDES